VENRVRSLSYRDMSGMLALGGTILGTSRDKPRKMHMGHEVMDMTETAIANARSHGMDCLVCLGGGGTQKNAFHLAEAGPIGGADPNFRSCRSMSYSCIKPLSANGRANS